jgi:hypothetical protein
MEQKKPVVLWGNDNSCTLYKEFILFSRETEMKQLFALIKTPHNKGV